MGNAKFFPRRLSFSKLCDILVAYLNAGADKDFFGVSDVVAKSNVTLHNISRNNGFLFRITTAFLHFLYSQKTHQQQERFTKV